MRSRAVVLAIVVILFGGEFLGVCWATPREWTSSTGKKMMAELVGIVDGKASLKRSDGKVVAVPLEQLSSADQSFLKVASESAADAAKGGGSGPLTPKSENSKSEAIALLPNSDPFATDVLDRGGLAAAQSGESAKIDAKPIKPATFDSMSERVLIAMERRDYELALYYLEGADELAQSKDEKKALEDLRLHVENMNRAWEAFPGICTSVLQLGGSIVLDERSLTVEAIEGDSFVLNDGRQAYTFDRTNWRSIPAELARALVHSFLKVEPTFEGVYSTMKAVDGSHRDDYFWKMANRSASEKGALKRRTGNEESDGGNSAPAAKEKKMPLPPEKEILTRRDELREVFRAEFDALRSPAQRYAMAQKIYDKAKTPDVTSPATTAALLLEAAELVAKAGVLTDAWVVLDRFGELFEVPDLAERKIKLAEKGTAVPSAAESKKQVERCLELFDELESKNSFSASDSLAKIASSASRISRERSVVDAVSARIAKHKETKKAFEKLAAARDKMKQNPDDAGANFVVGSHLCFEKQNWPEGLVCLGKGNVPEFSQAAQLDLAEPTEAKDQLGAGDAWWNLALKYPALSRPLANRASEWYAKALAGLSGIEKLRAGNRIDQVQAMEKQAIAATKSKSQVASQPPEE